MTHKIKITKTKEPTKSMKTSKYTLICSNIYEDRIVLMREAILNSRNEEEVKFPLEY